MRVYGRVSRYIIVFDFTWSAALSIRVHEQTAVPLYTLSKTSFSNHLFAPKRKKEVADVTDVVKRWLCGNKVRS